MTDGPSHASPAEHEGTAIVGIHPGALGDVVLFGQLLAALRDRRGGRTRLAAGYEKARLLAGLGAVDEAIDFEALPMAEVFSDAPRSRCAMPGAIGGCGLLLSCFATGDPPVQQRLAELAGPVRSLFLPPRPPDDYEGHLLELWSELAGIGPVAPPRWTVPPAWRARAREALGEGSTPPAPHVLIHPGSGSRGKCWPLERFVELAGAVAMRCVFVVGPTELDWWGGAAIDALRREFTTVVSPPLEVLAALAAGASGYVGNDSGPTHLAAAVGAPTVALFGPTRPEHFAPRGRRVAVIARPRIERIAPDRVIAALEKL